MDDASERHVGIWLWKHSRELQTADERREFFDLCRGTAWSARKIDFFDHEAKEVIDLYDAILREAAASTPDAGLPRRQQTDRASTAPGRTS